MKRKYRKEKREKIDEKEGKGGKRKGKNIEIVRKRKEERE